MKPIYILALHGVRTGGPEAIHQLSDALIEQGFDARMVYFDRGQIAALEQASPQDGYQFGARENPIEEYARYKVNVAAHVPNTEGVIVVLPETLCHLAPKFDKATVLIWWLSVDNGFGALSRVNLNHLRRHQVYHVAQSRYAYELLAALQLPKRLGGMLSDYTVDLTEYATPMPMSDRPKIVAYNGNHKVTANWPAIKEALREIDPEIECMPVWGERSEIAEVFSMARVYVDLGCFPGKDRMPREAAAMGCFVLVASYGAGGADLVNWAEPPGTYWPSAIADAVLNPERQRTIRRGSFGSERDVFFREVREVFSGL